VLDEGVIDGMSVPGTPSAGAAVAPKFVGSDRSRIIAAAASKISPATAAATLNTACSDRRRIGPRTRSLRHVGVPATTRNAGRGTQQQSAADRG
jgi:hypothetical protein